MKEQSRLDAIDQIIDEIIAELPLKERTDFANMNKEDAEILQRTFDLYIRRKIGSKTEDDEYSDIMNKLWERLSETHRLRIVK
ncbi:MAG: hypothetical protein Q7J15_10945 [Candidatus Desulfaltia sp.]|nr:hypothetical protein [Candidatus Desulfaltia sp.]